MKRMYKILLLAVLITVVFVTSGCRRDGASAGSGRDARTARMDTLIVGLAGMPNNLDPSLTNDMPSAYIHEHIYNTLITVDYDMNPVPALAERWVWEDPTRLRIFLRRGVRFHNGDELRASDVKFTLDRAAVAPQIGHITGMIANTAIVNDYEVLITLQYPFVPFLSHLAHTAASIVNEGVVRQLGDVGHSQAPVGTGPYRVVNIVQGDRIELTRWDNYWGTAAAAPNLVWRVMTDAATRLVSLETGEIDVMFAVAPTDMTRVRNHRDLDLHHEMSLSTNYIGFNVTRPPFNDVRVRHAIQYALNMEAMVQAVYLGAMTPTSGPINSRVWGSTAEPRPAFPHDVARARQLLAEAGYPNGFSTTFFTNEGNPQRQDTGEVMANMLREVGINMEVRLVEWGAYLDMTARGEAPLYMLGWVTVTGDPDYGLHALFHTSNQGGAGNRGFYSNTNVDRLLDQGRQETDPTRRAAIYRELQQILHDDAPWISQSAGAEIIGVRSNVHGFRIHPHGRHQMWGVSLR